jgi:hypothetical protein
VTTGNNQAYPDVPCYRATTGWDPVTGLGTPNAANLVPALAFRIAVSLLSGEEPGPKGPGS